MLTIEKPLLEDYVKRVQELKNNNIKIIGFMCSFVPEEIIHAAGAFPLRLNLGGLEDIALEGGKLMSVGTCPYARSTLGYFLTHHPLYSLCDLVITGNFCNAMESIQDYADYIKIPNINLDVPRKTDSVSINYFSKEITQFKEAIEKFCETKISSNQLISSIYLYNELRSLLKHINELRMQDNPHLTGTESLHLIHETFLTHTEIMIEKLRLIFPPLKKRSITPKTNRLIISGSNIAFDDEIIQIIEDLGGIVVGDDTCTGMRFYWDNVELNGDPLLALAKRYLTKIPCARMYPDSSRFEFVKSLCENYHASGVINYNLKFCDPFQLKKYPFKDFVQDELGLPILILEREYTQGDLEQVRNRIQAFMEML